MPKIVCEKCGKLCKDEALAIQDRHFHPQCLCCEACGKTLSGSFCEKNGKFYCIEDYRDLFGPKCAECHQALEGEVLSMEGLQFHPECFKCQHCGRQVHHGDKFVIKRGLRACQACRPWLCKMCQLFVKPEDRVTFDGVSFHRACLKCRSCKRPLEEEETQIFNRRPFCPEHFALFSNRGVDTTRPAQRPSSDQTPKPQPLVAAPGASQAPAPPESKSSPEKSSATPPRAVPASPIPEPLVSPPSSPFASAPSRECLLSPVQPPKPTGRQSMDTPANLRATKPRSESVVSGASVVMECPALAQQPEPITEDGEPAGTITPVRIPSTKKRKSAVPPQTPVDVPSTVPTDSQLNTPSASSVLKLQHQRLRSTLKRSSRLSDRASSDGSEVSAISSSTCTTTGSLSESGRAQMRARRKEEMKRRMKMRKGTNASSTPVRQQPGEASPPARQPSVPVPSRPSSSSSRQQSIDEPAAQQQLASPPATVAKSTTSAAVSRAKAAPSPTQVVVPARQTSSPRSSVSTARSARGTSVDAPLVSMVGATIPARSRTSTLSREASIEAPSSPVRHASMPRPATPTRETSLDGPFAVNTKAAVVAAAARGTSVDAALAAAQQHTTAKAAPEPTQPKTPSPLKADTELKRRQQREEAQPPIAAAPATASPVVSPAVSPAASPTRHSSARAVSEDASVPRSSASSSSALEQAQPALVTRPPASIVSPTRPAKTRQLGRQTSPETVKPFPPGPDASSREADELKKRREAEAEAEAARVEAARVDAARAEAARAEAARAEAARAEAARAEAARQKDKKQDVAVVESRVQALAGSGDESYLSNVSPDRAMTSSPARAPERRLSVGSEGSDAKLGRLSAEETPIATVLRRNSRSPADKLARFLANTDDDAAERARRASMQRVAARQSKVSFASFAETDDPGHLLPGDPRLAFVSGIYTKDKRLSIEELDPSMLNPQDEMPLSRKKTWDEYRRSMEDGMDHDRITPSPLGSRREGEGGRERPPPSPTSEHESHTSRSDGKSIGTSVESSPGASDTPSSTAQFRSTTGHAEASRTGFDKRDLIRTTSDDVFHSLEAIAGGSSGPSTRTSSLKQLPVVAVPDADGSAEGETSLEAYQRRAEERKRQRELRRQQEKLHSRHTSSSSVTSSVCSNEGLCVGNGDFRSAASSFSAYGTSVSADTLDPATNKMTLAELHRKRRRIGTKLNMGQLEEYLVDDQFVDLFGMQRDEFRSLPRWKRQTLRKMHNLF